MFNPNRITKEQALSFLLTYIVVEKQCSFAISPQTLFSLVTLASEAEERINKEEGIIPHEVIEDLAENFMATL